MRTIAAFIVGLVGLTGGAQAQPLVFTHLAGIPDSPGAADGKGGDARFHTPYAVAADAAGNVYVADGNETIRKISLDGRVSTLAGLEGTRGSADGTGSGARFFSALGLAVDQAGNVYVADNGNHTVRRITPSGLVTTLAGLAGSSGDVDGSGSSARFTSPAGIAVDGAGNLYVSEWSHVIRKVTPAGDVTTLAGRAGSPGFADGPGGQARFSLFPGGGLAADPAGNVYVADTVNDTIRRVTPAGVVTTIAGAPGEPGFADGTGISARFYNPWSVALDATGNLYVGDTFNFRVRKISTSGLVTTLAGSGSPGDADGNGLAASFDEFWGISVDAAGNVYVADTNNNTVRKVGPAGLVSTLAGRAGSSGSADGPGMSARFAFPTAVATDAAANLYVADNRNHTVRKISPGGAVTTLAGQAGFVGAEDGPGAAARFGGLFGLAADASGNVFAPDADYNTVRKITPAGFATTVAGSPGVPGSADGVGPLARFSAPFGAATDRDGNVYVCDTYNHTVRKIDPAGTVSTLAGVAGVAGFADGPARLALFSQPYGCAVDAAGDVYVSEFINSTIRKITPSGIVMTMAGSARILGSADGPGNEARFRQPSGIAVDGAGNVFVADTYNETIRKVSPDGFVTTVGGLAGSSGNRDGTGGEARFERPEGVALDAVGNLFVADAGNNSIRVGRPATGGGVLPDVATIDAPSGSVGAKRQLDVSPRTATSWEWTIFRQPSGSTANLSSPTVPNPTFIPDAPDLYLFRLVATGISGSRTSYVSLQVEPRVVTLTRVAPIVLDVDNGSAHYTTELTFTNDEPSPTSVAMTYTPSMGSKSGGGTVTEALAPGEQRRIPDVLAYLRSKGLSIPPASAEPSQGGTLRLVFTGEAVDASRVTALARTTAETAAPLPAGRAGFACGAALLSDASGSALIGGLRSNETDRSNLAVANFSDQPATYGVTVQDLTPDHRPPYRSVIVRENQTLPPWGWAQVNSAELLDAAGIRDGLVIVGGSASLYVYGVINDRVTNDASFLRPLTLPFDAVFIPAVVETSGFVTELTFSNEGMHVTAFSLAYDESLSPALGIGGNGLFVMNDFQQQIVPNAIEMLRQKPPIMIGPAGAASYGGVLDVLPIMDGFVTSRTLTRPASPADGRFGFSPPEIRSADAASDRAAIYGLVSDDANRSNAAVMHIGDPTSDGPVTLRLQVHDGAAGGAAKGQPITVTLAPRAWRQINGILRSAGATEGWVEITRVSGTAPWYAYGVINDGAFPGERTGDGSYVAMTK